MSILSVGSLLNAFGRRRHLDESSLLALWSTRAATGTDGPCLEDAHLLECGRCRARYDALDGWLSDVRTDAVDEADALFPSDRLAAQQSQIGRRLEALDRPARVIAFPRFSRPTAVARRGPQRWIAAAAAAGLIVGLGAGELLDLKRVVRVTDAAARRAASPAAAQAARGVVQASLSSDDSFLYDSEAAAPRVEALQALDALTPRLRDLDQSR